jgi:hypothetical protein
MTIVGQPLQEYDGRKTLRSLADALEKLREFGVFSDDGRAEIKTMEMVLPDRRTMCLVAVLGGPCQRDGARWVIRMPSSLRFTARTTLGEQLTYEIGLLNDAISDFDGNVQLSEGQFVHQVDLVPSRLDYDFTAIQDAIVRHALKFLQVEDQCYRPLDDKHLPGLRVLDYGTIRNVRIPSLKAVQNYVEDHLEGVSRPEIVTALRLAGMQFPRARP